MKANQDSDRGRKLIPVGLFATLGALPFVLWAVYLAPPELVESIGPIPVVRTGEAIQWLPDLDSGSFDALEWVAGVLAGVGLVALAIVYSLALVIGVLGVAATLLGVFLLGDPRHLGRVVSRLSNHPLFWLVIGVYALFGGVVFVPGLVVIVVELAVAVMVGGTLLVVFGAGWVEFRSRTSRAVRIAIAYPFAIGAIVVPVAATTLVSPTFATIARVATEGLAIIILDTVFQFGDINRWIRATFDLDGSGYLLMWLAIAISLGWIAGTGIELGMHVRNRRRKLARQ